MIQNDIDLLEEVTYKDPYFFAIKLLNLKKNKKKATKNRKNSHFKFLIEQENYVVDQTGNKIDNIFWILRTPSISLNKQTLYFFVPDVQSSNAEFQLKMYVISNEEVQQLGTMPVNSLTYIEVLLEFGKTVFRQTVSLCVQYTLEYQIYVEKSKLQLQNLLKNSKDDTHELKNAFKKKSHEIIQIENEKVEVKNKNNQHHQRNLLRKSLHFNKKKLMQVKKRNQQLKERSASQSMSHGSFLSKIGGIFRQKPIQNQQDRRVRLNKLSETTQNKTKKADSQKSFALLPPSIGPHKYNRPQNKFYYSSLNIERQKQRQRVKMYQTPGNKEFQTKQVVSYSFLSILKVVVIILLFTFVMYYLSSPSKKGKVKFFKNWDLFNF